MIDNWMKELPALASGGVYACPVDGCDHVFSVSPPTVESTFGQGLMVHGIRLSTFEEVLELHVAEHTAVDFLRTIRARDIRITELESTLDGWCH